MKHECRWAGGTYSPDGFFLYLPLLGKERGYNGVAGALWERFGIYNPLSPRGRGGVFWRLLVLFSLRRKSELLRCDTSTQASVVPFFFTLTLCAAGFALEL